jgi:heme oxygenase
MLHKTALMRHALALYLSHVVTAKPLNNFARHALERLSQQTAHKNRLPDVANGYFSWGREMHPALSRREEKPCRPMNCLPRFS